MAIADVMTSNAVTVSAGETVAHAVTRMVAANVGAVVVCDGPRIAGIFTERDVLRLAGSSTHGRFDTLRVDDVMTRPVITIPADADVLHAAEMMGRHRIRHLPVVEGENLLGVVGIRDVLDVLVEKAWATHDPVARERAHQLLSRVPGRPYAEDDF
jgi:CBS domain-containing protein